MCKIFWEVLLVNSIVIGVFLSFIGCLYFIGWNFGFISGDPLVGLLMVNIFNCVINLLGIFDDDYEVIVFVEFDVGVDV